MKTIKVSKEELGIQIYSVIEELSKAEKCLRESKRAKSGNVLRGKVCDKCGHIEWHEELIKYSEFIVSQKKYIKQMKRLIKKMRGLNEREII